MRAFGNEKAICQVWTIAGDHSGIRADHYLAGRIGRISRTRAKQIILCGDFRRQDGDLKPSQTLKAGEVVHLWRFPPNEDELDLLSVGVLFEDEDWLVVDKPPNLAVHPTARYLHHTLTGWLKNYAPDVPIHPCHRLDRETSGVLVCAKNRIAEAALKTCFQRGEVEKNYLAIVRGRMSDSVMIDAPLALQGERGLVKIRMIVDLQAGMPSKTFVTPIYHDDVLNRTLVSCEPQTGRQHQIRAHLAHIGHPIVGDKLYAMGDEFFDAYTRKDLGDRIQELEHPRHALHAHRISFVFNGKKLKFQSPMPKELDSNA